MTAPTMSSSAFERQYAAAAEMTVVELRLVRRIVPCDREACSYEPCSGWGMVPIDSDLCGACGHYAWVHPSDACAEFTRVGRCEDEECDELALAGIGDPSRWLCERHLVDAFAGIRALISDIRRI